MGRTWVPIVGAVAGLVFVLTQLTGSDIDDEAARAVGTAFALVLFGVFGSAGVALAHWQPRYALIGIVTAMLALLACGATVALLWSSDPSFFIFFFDGPSGTATAITELLALAGAAICVLLATTRSGEDKEARLSRVVAAAAFALLVALAIIQFIHPDTDIGPKVYALLATVFVVATAVLFVLRLLPLPKDSQAAS